MRATYFAALAFVAALCIAAALSPAHSQSSRCAPISVFERDMRERYNETPIIKLHGKDGRFLLIFATGDRETWTVIDVNAAGIGCLQFSGETWEPAYPSEYEGEPS